MRGRPVLVPAEAVEEFGEIGLPDDAGFDIAVQAVARAMMGVGYDTEAQTGDRQLVTRFCPFGETATNHPEIVCSIDQGIVKGLLEAAHHELLPIVTPHGGTDENCLTDV